MRPYPVLLAFLAFFTGIFCAGTMGTAHGMLVCGGLAGGAALVTRLRGLRTPGLAMPLVLFFLLGAGRWGADGTRTDHKASTLAAPVQAALSQDDGRPTVLVTVDRMIRRDRHSTRARVSILSVLGTHGWIGCPTGFRMILNARGFSPILAGGSYVVRGRLRPPRPTREALSPAWPSKPPSYWMTVSRPSDLVTVDIPERQTPSALDRVRHRIAQRLLSVLKGDAADFALAILLGEGGGIDPAVRDGLSLLGTAHILAVSGLHVAAAGLVAGLLFMGLCGPFLARFAPGSDPSRVRLAFAVLAGLTVATLAGLSPSSQRAGCMLTVAVAAAVAGRRQGLESLAGLVGLASLAWHPEDAFSLSFILSYSAILGIAGATGRLTGLLVRDSPLDRTRWSTTVKRAIAGAAACSLAATLATAPAILFAFGTLGVAGPIANLAVLPVMTFLIMPVAMVLLVVAVAVPSLLDAAAPAIQPLFSLFTGLQVDLAGWLPYIPWTASRFLFSLGVSGSAGFLTGLARGGRSAGLLVAGAAFLLAFFLGPRPPPHHEADLTVTFIDAGKGDAILVRCPGGLDYLVDTAQERAVYRSGGILEALRSRGVRELQAIVVTHGDSDHSGGLLRLTGAMAVREVVVPCQEAVRPPMNEAMKRLRRDGVKTRCLVAGMEALPGCGARSTVLWPPPMKRLEGNGASLVFRVGWGRHSVLLTGDLEAEQETALLDSGAELGSAVLKLAHHGSATSTGEAFLRAVNPSSVVVSGWVTRADDGVPEKVLDRVDAQGARAWSTRTHGNITVRIEHKTGKSLIYSGRTPILPPLSPRSHAAKSCP